MTRQLFSMYVCLLTFGATQIACTETNEGSRQLQHVDRSAESRVIRSVVEDGLDKDIDFDCKEIDVTDNDNDEVTITYDSGVVISIPTNSLCSGDSGPSGTIRVCTKPYSSEETMPGYRDGGLEGIYNDAQVTQIVTLGAIDLWATDNENTLTLAKGASLTITIPIPSDRECYKDYLADGDPLIWLLGPDAGRWTATNNKKWNFIDGGTTFPVSMDAGIMDGNTPICPGTPIPKINVDIKRPDGGIPPCDDAGEDDAGA